ncbi:MAG: LuxR C-terminal-related transcriptional regulator [Sulfitobacter sp.]
MTSSLDPFEKTVSEINGRFKIHCDQEDCWQIIQNIVHDIGGSAVNMAGTTLSGEQAAWARSSMSADWLKKYTTKNYHLVDPFITALISRLPEVKTDCGVLGRSDPAYELNHDLKAHGYGSLFASTSGSLSSGYRAMVVFCSEHTLTEVDASIGFGRLRIIHAIIAANMPTQINENEPGHVTVRRTPLTAKEYDVLNWLACGLRNDQIAFNGNIAEVTVRKHLQSIRKKLGATTREQAIAIAVRDGWIAP